MEANILKAIWALGPNILRALTKFWGQLVWRIALFQPLTYLLFRSFEEILAPKSFQKIQIFQMMIKYFVYEIFQHTQKMLSTVQPRFTDIYKNNNKTVMIYIYLVLQ